MNPMEAPAGTGAASYDARALFADLAYWRAVRGQVVPLLRTYPTIRVWVAGCGSGAEAYAMAIVLREAGLAHRSYVYATDVSEDVVARAGAGRMPADEVAAAEESYRASAGDSGLGGHFHFADGVATLAPELKDRLLFAVHDPATDGSLNEFHMVVCRDGLGGGDDPDTRLRRYRLARTSLCRLGILALGPADHLPDDERAFYEPFAEPGLLRRRA